MSTRTRVTDGLPVDDRTDQWPVWGTTARLVVTDPGALTAARAIADHHLGAVDLACSRFRPDSELVLLAANGAGTTEVSLLLAELVAAALDAAARTDGALDPTVGQAMADLGYDDDLSLLPRHGPPVRLRVRRVPGWRQVGLEGSRLTLPPGVQLDLGSTAKAQAADQVAAMIATRLDVGVLVSLGGDISTAGPSPTAWRVLVQDQPDDNPAHVTLPTGSALATSSTRSRQWQRGRRLLHHVLDPRTGMPATRVWNNVSVAGWTCLEANTLSTAAIVKGLDAVAWLREVGAPARLVRADGAALTLGDWPTELAA
ncbi:MAG: FAD:protein transferase [Actinomycetota bacterium]|nr:FAD:protein transferase [Actinomycetota bacterium]